MSEVAFWVADVERALEFYRDRIGLAVTEYEPGKHAFLQAGDALIVLFNRTDPGTVLGDKYLARLGGPRGEVYHVALRLDPPDLDGFAATLRSRGIPVGDLVAFQNGRRSYFLEDLDEHTIELTDR